ncbi:heterokaryon incompatibility protein-domain-containing protein [Astrocystis sublimbata]|nr:heterokaryon incompatibility protein-domain-containing protein [Astrocystis sublimbata]
MSYDMDSVLVYTHPPLTDDDGIRILHSQPAQSRDGDLRGSLHQVLLADQYEDLIDQYTALSYVWGDPTPADAILFDGTKLDITANLSAALRDLRDPKRVHKLWIDAICIDQSNLPEKSKQVARMDKIYGGASNTIIYLGPLHPCVDGFMDSAKELAHLNRYENYDRYFPHSDYYDTNFKDIKNAHLAAAREVGLMYPWFRRIWVLQELVLSRSPWVQCGLKRV